MESRVVLRWGLLAIAVALAVLVAVLQYGGGAPEASAVGLPTPGFVTQWGVPVLRVTADLAGIVTVGLTLAAAFLLPGRLNALSATGRRSLRCATWSASAWAMTSAAQIVFTNSDFLAVPLDKAVSLPLLANFVSETLQGTLLAAQGLLAAVIALSTRRTRTTAGAYGLLGASLVAMAAPLLTGHVASSANYQLAVASLFVHVLAASLWVGGVAALVWAASAGSTEMVSAIPRFSTLALWCFCAVAGSGVLNATIRLGRLEALWSTSYGMLVLAKVAALGALGLFGLRHRRVIGRRLADRHPASSAPDERSQAPDFLSLAAGELLVMTATVALAVGLARTPTPIDPAPVASAGTRLTSGSAFSTGSLAERPHGKSRLGFESWML